MMSQAVPKNSHLLLPAAAPVPFLTFITHPRKAGQRTPDIIQKKYIII